MKCDKCGKHDKCDKYGCPLEGMIEDGEKLSIGVMVMDATKTSARQRYLDRLTRKVEHTTPKRQGNARQRYIDRLTRRNTQ